MNKSREYKKVNWGFFAFVIANILEILIMIVLIIAGVDVDISSVLVDTLLAEGCIFLPPAIFLACSKYELGIFERLGLRKMRWQTWFVVFFYAIAVIPVGTLFNAISMIWVDNTVLESSGSIISAPWYIALLSVAIIPALVEEFMFRGFMYNGYRTGGAKFAAVIASALAFSFMHMNFNQAAYALFLGIMFALIVEATGSLWSSILCHFIFNAESVVLMLLIEWIEPGAIEETAAEETDMLSSIPTYALVAVVALTIAILLLLLAAKLQGRTASLKYLFTKRLPEREKVHVWSVPLIIALVICFAWMVIFR